MSKRPKLINVLCILLAVAFLLNVGPVLSAYGWVSDGRFAWIVATNLLAALSIVGIWQMRLWGPLLYFVGQTVGIITFFLIPPPGAEMVPIWLLFAIPLIVAIPIAIHWKSFTLSGRKANA